MRMDLGQPVEFQIYEAEETELAATGVGPQSNPIMVRVMRLRPWTPTWEYNPA